MELSDGASLATNTCIKIEGGGDFHVAWMLEPRYAAAAAPPQKQQQGSRRRGERTIVDACDGFPRRDGALKRAVFEGAAGK